MKQDGNQKDQNYHCEILQDVEENANLVKEITCSCFHGFIDKDLINLVIPDVRRYVVVLTRPEHADDEIVAEDQPYAEDASPIAQSPEYVLESDFEMHPEDDDDESVDYPADGGDDGDDEEESSEDDKDEEDDEMDVEADEKEEEE
nr:hypothetical protein [Tanacetum cinerariifolium]